MAQIVITYHNEKAGGPLIEETCHSKGVNLSNKIMVFLPGLAQIFQFREILQRALALGWIEHWAFCAEVLESIASGSGSYAPVFFVVESISSSSVSCAPVSFALLLSIFY